MSSKSHNRKSKKINVAIRKMQTCLTNDNVTVLSSKKIWIAKKFISHFNIDPPRALTKKHIDKWALDLYNDPDFTLIGPGVKNPSQQIKALNPKKKKHLGALNIGGEKLQRKACSNISGNKVYLILCWKGNEKFLKVGMTKGSLERRFKDIPYNWKEVTHTKVEGQWMFEFEQAIHGLMKKYRYYPNTKFVGYTECYKMEARDEILAFLG